MDNIFYKIASQWIGHSEQDVQEILEQSTEVSDRAKRAFVQVLDDDDPTSKEEGVEYLYELLFDANPDDDEQIRRLLDFLGDTRMTPRGSVIPSKSLQEDFGIGHRDSNSDSLKRLTAVTNLEELQEQWNISDTLHDAPFNKYVYANDKFYVWPVRDRSARGGFPHHKDVVDTFGLINFDYIGTYSRNDDRLEIYSEPIEGVDQTFLDRAISMFNPSTVEADFQEYDVSGLNTKTSDADDPNAITLSHNPSGDRSDRFVILDGTIYFWPMQQGYHALGLKKIEQDIGSSFQSMSMSSFGYYFQNGGYSYFTDNDVNQEIVDLNVMKDAAPEAKEAQNSINYEYPKIYDLNNIEESVETNRILGEYVEDPDNLRSGTVREILENGSVLVEWEYEEEDEDGDLIYEEKVEKSEYIKDLLGLEKRHASSLAIRTSSFAIGDQVKDFNQDIGEVIYIDPDDPDMMYNVMFGFDVFGQPIDSWYSEEDLSIATDEDMVNTNRKSIPEYKEAPYGGRCKFFITPEGTAYNWRDTGYDCHHGQAMIQLFEREPDGFIYDEYTIQDYFEDSGVGTRDAAIEEGTVIGVTSSNFIACMGYSITEEQKVKLKEIAASNPNISNYQLEIDEIVSENYKTREEFFTAMDEIVSYTKTAAPRFDAKRGMASQTGIPDIDGVIEDFKNTEIEMINYENNSFTLVPVRDLENQDISLNQCGNITNAFTRFATDRGIVAIREEDENGTDYLGYGQEPFHPDADSGHVWNTIITPDAKYVVDWTASQYGEKEFPLVQRVKGRGKPRRQWKSAAPRLNRNNRFRVEQEEMGNAHKFILTPEGKFYAWSKKDDIHYGHGMIALENDGEMFDELDEYTRYEWNNEPNEAYQYYRQNGYATGQTSSGSWFMVNAPSGLNESQVESLESHFREAGYRNVVIQEPGDKKTFNSGKDALDYLSPRRNPEIEEEDHSGFFENTDGFGGAKMASSNTSIESLVERSDLYWRVHWEEASDFSPENAVSFSGGMSNIDVSLQQNKICPDCHGSGRNSHSGNECFVCLGDGWVPADETEYLDNINSRKGYSCLTSAESLFDYVNAVWDVDDYEPVVVFSGDYIGKGDDEEPLSIPDMKEVYWFTWGDLEETLGREKMASLSVGDSVVHNASGVEGKIMGIEEDKITFSNGAFSFDGSTTDFSPISEVSITQDLNRFYKFVIFNGSIDIWEGASDNHIYRLHELEIGDGDHVVCGDVNDPDENYEEDRDYVDIFTFGTYPTEEDYRIIEENFPGSSVTFLGDQEEK